VSDQAVAEQFASQAETAWREYRQELKRPSFLLAYAVSGLLCVILIGIPLLVLVSWVRRQHRENARNRLVHRLRKLAAEAAMAGVPPEAIDGAVAGIAGKRVLELIHDTKGRVLRAVRLPAGEPEMPWLCGVTGEPADVEVPLHAFSWKPLVAAGGSIGFAAWQFRRVPIRLPFSHEGLALYKRRRPTFDKVKEGGLTVASVIPLLPVDLVWMCFCYGALWWLPVLDRLRGRRALVKARVLPGAGKKGECRVIQVSSEAFADEFLLANPDARREVSDSQIVEQVVGNVIEEQSYCPACGEETPHQRGGVDNLTHGMLSIVTMGLWMLVWLPKAIRSAKWRCTRCGRRSATLEPPPRETQAAASAEA
jgi:hypothetical protein